MKAKSKNNIRRIIDAVLTVILLCLMAFQVTGEMAHEWLGIGMTVLVILHQILNIKWYGALFKGKYRTYRIIQTAVNILLLLSFAATAFSGMAMSGYAVPFLYGMAKVSLARRVHLSLSHWTFVLMAVHLGLHIIFLNHSRVLHSLLNYNFLTIHDVQALRGLSHAATLQVIDNAIHFFTIH